MIDFGQYAYDVSVLDQQGRLLHLPVGSLVWEEQADEFSTSVTCVFPDVVTTEGPMRNLVLPGTPFYLSLVERGGGGAGVYTPTTSSGAAWDPVTGGTTGGVQMGSVAGELVRGQIVKLQQSSDGISIEVTIRDNLATLVKDDVDVHIEAGTSVEQALSDLFAKWGVTLGEVNWPQANLPEMTMRGQTAASVVDEILAAAPKQGIGLYTLRSRGDVVDLITPGSNTQVYWLQTGAGAGVSRYSVDISAMVNSVMVVPAGDKKEKDPKANKEKPATKWGKQGREPVEPKPGEPEEEEEEEPPPQNPFEVTGGEVGFNGAVKFIVRDQKVTDEMATLEAEQALAEFGFPIQQFDHQTFDVPKVRKWDRIRITDSLVDGYFLVTGVSHDASAGTMNLVLKTPEDFEREMLRITLEAQLEGLKTQQAEAEKAKAESKKLSKARTKAAGSGKFDRDAPAFQQSTDWTCSAASTAHLLNMCYVDATEQEVVARLGPGISSAVGLHDASGSQLRRILSEEGIESVGRHLGSNEFDEALSIFRTGVGAMSGGAWYHWTSVRGVEGETLVLMNPAPGYQGVGQIMNRSDFGRLGPWNLVIVQELPKKLA